MRKVTLVALAGAIGGIPFVACSGNKPPPPVVATPIVDAAADADAGADAAPEAAASDAGAPLAAADAGADAGAKPPLNLTDALDGAIDLALKAAAIKDAPNMTAEGAPGRASLAENEHFGMIVTLAPNRCYTIIAFSPPGQVAQLDVKLMAPPFYNVPAGSSAATDKNLAEVGKGKAALCPILPVPVPYKVDVSAKKGAGRIGVQLFGRSK
jgi:hypothetical protein